MKNFFLELKNRKIRKWLAIYISTAITTMGVFHLFSVRYDLPSFIFDTVTLTLAFGILGTVLIAWFHGEAGRQKLKPVEIILHIFLFVIYILSVYFSIEWGVKPKTNSNNKVIAVLPFSNFNETSDNEFFADGITDDILTQLSKISDLKVISRTSVMKYKNTQMNISEISKELGAGSILEGSVRTYGNKIRIVGQLIDANNDVHIWSETYDRELEDIFDIQSDIAERIAAALQAKLLPLEMELIENQNTKNVDAYNVYLLGKHHYYKYTEEDNEKAIEFYKQALNIDPKYALAIAGLSDSYAQKVKKYWSDDVWMDSALVYGKIAVRLNPKLAEAYKALASAYDGQGEIELALANYEKAIELNPNYWSALLNYGQLKKLNGNYDEALYWLRKANVLAPGDIMGNISISMLYSDLNCFDAAIEWGEKALALDSDNRFANSFLGEVYLNSGDYKNAKKYFEQSIKLDSNWVFGWYVGARIESVLGNFKLSKKYFDKYHNITQTAPEYFYAHTLLKLDKDDSAKAIIEEELADYSSYLKDNPNFDNFIYISFAEVHAINKDKENAFKWWRKALNKGYIDANRIKVYPYFENLRNEPQYSILMNKMLTKLDSFKTEIRNNFPEYTECK